MSPLNDHEMWLSLVYFCFFSLCSVFLVVFLCFLWVFWVHGIMCTISRRWKRFLGHYVTSKDFSIAIRRTREIQQVDNIEENKHAATAQQ